MKGSGPAAISAMLNEIYIKHEQHPKNREAQTTWLSHKRPCFGLAVSRRSKVCFATCIRSRATGFISGHGSCFSPSRLGVVPAVRALLGTLARGFTGEASAA